MNQIQLKILELSDLGQVKVNNNKVMCNQSMKFSDRSDQNPPYTLERIGEHIPMKNALTA